MSRRTGVKSGVQSSEEKRDFKDERRCSGSGCCCHGLISFKNGQGAS